MAKKKYPLWFENPKEELRGMMGDMGDFFSAFRMPEMKFGDAKFIKVKLGETDDELVMLAEMPGFSKDEIKIKVSPKSVHIWTEKKKKTVDARDNFYMVQHSSVSASRAIELPEEIDSKNVRAKLKDGVLEIVMPKKESKKKDEKTIRIE